MTRSTPATIVAVFSAAIAASPACSAAPLPVCPMVNGQTVNYDILRGGDLIGHETIRFAVAGPDLTVTIDVMAALHALGIRVYRYEHHAEERWRDGQMVSLVTRTDDDGVPRKVDASRDPETGLWHGVTGIPPGTAPLLSTSFWNSETVVQTRLLDRETGAVFAVRNGAVTQQTLQIGQHAMTATKFDLAGLVTGSAWYDGNGCWVQALYHTRVDGSLIELRIHE